MSISYRKMGKEDIEKVIPLNICGKLGYGDVANLKLKSKFL